MPRPQSRGIASGFDPNASGYVHGNIAWNNVARWHRASRRMTGKALENGRRLQSLDRRKEFEPVAAEVYSEVDLRRYLQIELSIILGCTIVAMFNGIAAFSDAVLLIPVIVSAWIFTIAYRFYKHHIKCYLYIRTLRSSAGPRYGQLLDPIPSKVEYAATTKH